MPGPRSSTSTRSSPPEQSDLRATRWPSGPYFAALSTRASIACSTRTGSNLTMPFSSNVADRVASCPATSRTGPTLEACQQNLRLHGLHPEGWRGRLRTGQEEQVLDHPRHRRGLPDYLAKNFLVLAVPVEFQPDLSVAPDHGERGPELVGDFGEKLGPGAGSLGERLLGALALTVHRKTLDPLVSRWIILT